MRDGLLQTALQINHWRNSSHLPHLLSLKEFGTKKALHLVVESPLTHYECIGIFMALERAAGPSCKPSTLTRQSLVLGFFSVIDPFNFINSCYSGYFFIKPAKYKSHAQFRFFLPE
jgi:hypothetical protein